MAESEYLRQTVGEPLTRCLADVVLQRPHDPIEYIAHWLYKHASNVQHELQLAKEAEQLAKEIEQQKEAEELMIQLLLEEEKLHQRKKEQELEEARRLQAHNTDNAVDKEGPVPRVQSVPSIPYAAVQEEDDNKQEDDETESPVHSEPSQNVDSELDQQTEVPSSGEPELQVPSSGDPEIQRQM